jgi:hypothetical protein
MRGGEFLLGSVCGGVAGALVVSTIASNNFQKVVPNGYQAQVKKAIVCPARFAREAVADAQRRKISNPPEGLQYVENGSHTTCQYKTADGNYVLEFNMYGKDSKGRDLPPLVEAPAFAASAATAAPAPR